MFDFFMHLQIVKYKPKSSIYFLNVHWTGLLKLYSHCTSCYLSKQERHSYNTICQQIFLKIISNIHILNKIGCFFKSFRLEYVSESILVFV